MLRRSKRPIVLRRLLCGCGAMLVLTTSALGAEGFAPRPAQTGRDPQDVVASLAARAEQVAQLTRDAAGRGTGRESGSFVAVMTVSMLSSLGVGIVAARRRRLRGVRSPGLLPATISGAPSPQSL